MVGTRVTAIAVVGESTFAFVVVGVVVPGTGAARVVVTKVVSKCRPCGRTVVFARHVVTEHHRETQKRAHKRTKPGLTKTGTKRQRRNRVWVARWFARLSFADSEPPEKKGEKGGVAEPREAVL